MQHEVCHTFFTHRVYGVHIGKMADGDMPVVTALSKGHTVPEKLAN